MDVSPFKPAAHVVGMGVYLLKPKSSELLTFLV